MLIERTSMITGRRHVMDIPVTQEQLDAWERGELIQNAMPNLTADQREFIKTGITAEEWDLSFGDNGEESELEAKLNRPEGLSTLCNKSDSQNAARIILILNEYMLGTNLECAKRDSDNWEALDSLPMDFCNYKFRTAR